MRTDGHLANRLRACEASGPVPSAPPMSASAPETGGPLQGENALVRAIGPVALTAAIVNIIVGAGIFMLPALLASRMGGAAPLAFLAGALAIVPIALCFAAVGSRAVATGGAYTYVGAAFGPFAGFLAGALGWICNLASAAGVAAALMGQLAHFVPALAEPVARAAALIALQTALIALNAFGVRLGARAILALATLKLAPLIALAGIGLLFVDWGQISWTQVPSWSALGTAMVLVMFAYSGMETALIPSGEVRDPSRHVPRATLAAIVLVVLLYVGIQVVCQGVLGPALPGGAAPIAATAGALWSPGYGLLLATACVSMTGFLMGNLLGSSRLVFALGRDGYLPHAFGRVSAAHHVPLLAILVHGGLACVLAIGGSFETLALISGGANCLLYVGVCLAAWRAQRLDLRGRGAPFVLPGGPAIPLLAVLAMGAIVSTLTRAEWLAIGLALAALVAVYGLVRRRRSGTA
jgi:APA family basic amino acid/polyamine antiporter